MAKQTRAAHGTPGRCVFVEFGIEPGGLDAKQTPAKPALAPPVDPIEQIVQLRAEVSTLKRANADLTAEVDRLKRERTHWYLTCMAERDKSEGVKP